MTITCRTYFNESWLTEMPERVAPNNMYHSLAFNIRDLLSSGMKPDSLGNNLFRMKFTDYVYYWYQDHDGTIILAAELFTTPQNVIIRGVGKNPDKKYKGNPPSTPQLYDAILKNSGKSIRLLSDTLMTELGQDIWKRLFDLGHKISVYDNENPGQTFTTIHSKADFDQFFGDKDKKRYQFVLSEQSNFLDCKNYFLTRRMRELCGMGLTD